MKDTKKKCKKMIRKTSFCRLAFVLMLALSAVLFQNAAKAEENLLKVTEKTVYAGDEITISDYFSDKELAGVTYSFAATNTDSSCVTLDEKTGLVTAKKAGNVSIQIMYTLADETNTHIETFLVTVYDAEEITAAYGSEVTYQAYSVYAPEEFSYSFSADSVVPASQEDQWLIQGFRDCEVTVQNGERKITVAVVHVTQPVFEAGENLTRATGIEPYFPELTGYTALGEEKDIIWSVEDETIADITEKGIQAKCVGKTTLEAKITARNGDVATVTATFTATDPKLEKTLYVIAKGIKKTVTVTGTCENSIYVCDANDLTCAYFIEKNKLYANYKGTAELSLFVDGKPLTIKVIVTNPKYSQKKFTMYKGQTKKFSLSGLDKTNSQVTYKTTNKKVARVSSTGKVKAVKIGVTRIQAKADGKTITVWIEIAAKRAYRAAKKEISISKRKTRYSQARRMQKGYYDCSSIVSRVYRQYGVYFGRKSGWSPTAAGIGQWCSSHHKVIAKKAISSNKLVPGDLIFYSYTRNGRYRNISHIEMYVGNGKSVSASSSYNRVVHYGYKKSSVVLIARPLK